MGQSGWVGLAEAPPPSTGTQKVVSVGRGPDFDQFSLAANAENGLPFFPGKKVGDTVFVGGSVLLTHPPIFKNHWFLNGSHCFISIRILAGFHRPPHNCCLTSIPPPRTKNTTECRADPIARARGSLSWRVAICAWMDVVSIRCHCHICTQQSFFLYQDIRRGGHTRIEPQHK